MSNYPEGAYAKLSAMWDDESRMEKAIEYASEEILHEIIADPYDLACEAGIEDNRSDVVVAWAKIALNGFDSAMIVMPETHKELYPIVNKWVEFRAEQRIDDYA